MQVADPHAQAQSWNPHAQVLHTYSHAGGPTYNGSPMQPMMMYNGMMHVDIPLGGHAHPEPAACQRSMSGASSGNSGQLANQGQQNNMVTWGNVINVQLNSNWSLPNGEPGFQKPGKLELSDAGSTSARSTEGGSLSFECPASALSLARKLSSASEDYSSSDFDSSSSTLEHFKDLHVDAPRVKQEVAWSEGSADHESLKCRPCAWYWKPGGCSNGSACTFCHLCEADEMKSRKQQKIQKLKDAASTLGHGKTKASKKNLVSL